ncbi:MULTISPECIES: RNA recognition motif domain-containing protein [unclassified Tolypothrix]|uniref:RNA recognition motif domain-containing protein n=1 Tax=unclassified Tolypothrix TaxID=2649714 RepID=UPI0005EAA84B|nr:MULTISPECIES: RNA-binding protein [unclassified Tolypothrix]BAY91861.1 RNP-1 like RNA-binding protein [Microchaete diplosiphon NIES-3275]EKF04976.1 RNA-binding protein [Tolypothrix sp. PCC 7601]MBE9081270.1 RNA-binding protein [Tolypothrix sp. LEGE 11397]UYD25869.1 RNA-binding protein [Tolypothrix sp. PCC 7712]UYD31893.1 RNA-binding protein [Tolypothrix sp. PCC 7601]
MSVRLYIGNLPKEEIDRQELQAVFAAEGDAVTTKLIKDRKTGKCRGFGFLTVNNDEQADQIIEKYNGQLFKDTAIKLEKALPRTKGDEGDEQAPKAAQSAGSSNPAPVTHKESNRRDKSSKKSRRGGAASGGRETTTTSDSDAIRPDPRWASELEKLKQMLAAQTTN